MVMRGEVRGQDQEGVLEQSSSSAWTIGQSLCMTGPNVSFSLVMHA